MSEMETEILEKAEKVMLKKIEGYLADTEKMTDKDCYNLQLFIVNIGRIRGIKEGKTYTVAV